MTSESTEIESSSTVSAGDQAPPEREWRRMMLSQLPAVLWTTDTNLHITACEGRGLELINLVPADVLGKSIREFLGNDDSYEGIAVHLAALRGESSVVEVEFQSRIGQWSVEPLREESGTVIGCAGFAIDITERKQDEQRLRDSERRLTQQFDELEHIYDTAPVGLCLVDTDLKYVRINEQLAAINGKPAEDHIGKTLHDIIPEIAATIELVYRRVLETGEPILDVEVRGQTASTGEEEGVWLVSYHPMFDGQGNIVGVSSVVQDITELKRNEQRLRDSEQRLQSIFDNTTAVVYAKDREGRYVLNNRRYEELFRFPPGSVVGKTDDELFPTEIAKSFRTNDLTVWESGQPVELEETAIVEGLSRTFISVKFLLTDENNQPYALCGISTDITEWRAAAEKSNKHQEELAHVARLNTMGEMASGLAHELNQPLTSIVGYVQGCLRRLQSGNWKLDEILDILERAVAQAMRGGKIISRIRKHVQPRDSQRDVIDLNDAVREVIAMIERQAAMDEVHLTLELEEKLPELYADRIQLEQVILNLTRNALESFRSVEGRQREITVRTEFDGHNTINLSVADNGPGIELPDLGKVFDQFFTTKPDGLGMGLAISRSIVEAHHGRLNADTNPNGGATFRFSLPISPS
jgi:PAS domain S-box-containing protein